MRCRFYENHFPEPEEVVMVNVTQIGEMGAYVTLLEYDDIEVRYTECFKLTCFGVNKHDDTLMSRILFERLLLCLDFRV